MIDKLDVYRISDPMFRIHSRLFRLQEAILRSSKQQLRASRLSVVSRAAGIGTLLTFLLTLIVQIYKIEWLSVPVVVIIMVGAAAILLHVLDYFELKEAEGKFDELLQDAGGDNAETWADYSEQLIAAYGARLKMASDAMDEANDLQAKHEMNDEAFRRRSEYLQGIIDYCNAQLQKYRAANERLHKEGKRTKEDFDSVLSFLQVAQPDYKPGSNASGASS